MKYCIFSLIATSSAMAFDGDPWVIEPFKPDLKAQYSYSFFSKVNGYTSNFYNQQFFAGLDVAFPNHFQLGVEFDQDATTFNDFYFRAASIEIKKQFSDDLAEGDFFSATTGIRGIAQTQTGRLDPATMYPGGYHFIAFISVGKEWSIRSDHFTKFWLLAALGGATHSSLWAQFEGTVLYRYRHNELKVFANSAIGYGAQEIVDINNFEGWGNTRYRYLDLGFTYGYEVADNLLLKVGFTKRSIGQIMPRNYNFFNFIIEKIF